MKGFSKMSALKPRKQRTRVRRKVYIIVCEGEKTERIYFKKYQTDCRYCNLKIETPNSKCTDPINLVKFARNQIKKKELDFEDGDAIWCVFDCDENTNENISRACKIAKNDIKICLSNPNFEYWFLLHYEFMVTRIERSEVIEKLKKYIPDYNKSKDISNLLLDKRSDAIVHAKKMNDMHKKNQIELISIESNPSTQVYSIVEAILKTIGKM